MSIKVTDRFLAPSRGTVEDVLRFWETNPPSRRQDSETIIRRVYDLCAASGMDFALAVSRIADETGSLNGPSFFVSDIYRERLNPGGIGVTDSEDKMIGFNNGKDAADAYMAHLFSYIFGSSYDVLGVMPDHDPRWDALADEHPEWFGSVKTLDDLRGKWFTNPDGAINSAARGNRIFPGIPDQDATPGGLPVADLVFGKVPLPTVQIRDITNKPEGTGWDDLGQRTPYGVVLHRMLGTLRGTDDYFRQAGVGALTDYGVGVAGSDAPEDDGVIIRWNDPRGRRAGWASGPVSSPYGDGLAFVNKFGINAVNRDLVSIEISGFQNTPLTAKSRAAIVGLMAYWADQCKIPWDKYPIGPHGFSVVYWHQEFTIGTGKECPFAVVMNETPELIKQVAAVMKEHQTKTTPQPGPQYTAPSLPSWFDAVANADYPQNQTFENGVVFLACKKKVRVKKATNQRATASTRGKLSGPDLAANTPVDILGTFKSGGPKYVLAAGSTTHRIAKGARIRMADLDELISITER